MLSQSDPSSEQTARTDASPRSPYLPSVSPPMWRCASANARVSSMRTRTHAGVYRFAHPPALMLRLS